jgi:hypothetical protein
MVEAEEVEAEEVVVGEAEAAALSPRLQGTTA